MFLKKPVSQFPPDSPEAEYVQMLTPYAFSLLKPHLDTYPYVEIYREVDEIACEFVTALGRIVTSFDACPCVFRISTGLPCHHIMAVRHLKNVAIFERQLVPDRWTRTYNMVHHVLPPVNGVAPQSDNPVHGLDQRSTSSAAPSVKPEKSKALNNHQKHKRALAVTNELALLISEAPMSIFIARLQEIKRLRDGWKAERPTSENVFHGLSQTEDVQGAFAANDGASGNLKIDGDDMVAVGVCETELVDLVNSVGVDGTMASNWVGEVENTVRYSDIKFPLRGRPCKRGRPCSVNKDAAAVKKRVKV